jgi:hypothetical protein
VVLRAIRADMLAFLTSVGAEKFTKTILSQGITICTIREFSEPVLVTAGVPAVLAKRVCVAALSLPEPEAGSSSVFISSAGGGAPEDGVRSRESEEALLLNDDNLEELYAADAKKAVNLGSVLYGAGTPRGSLRVDPESLPRQSVAQSNNEGSFRGGSQYADRQYSNSQF